MYLNLAILAESLSRVAALSPSAETHQLTLTGICPLASWCGDEIEDLAFIATEEEALASTELPPHALIACRVGTPREHLEALCLSLAAKGRKVACLASANDAPDLLLQASQTFSRLQAWDDRLVAAILRGADVQEVLTVGAEGLANPVALFDSASVLVAHSGELREGWQDSIWGDVIERGFVPMEHYSAEERRLFQHQILTSQTPVVAKPSKGHGESELACRIEVNGELFAMLAQVDLNVPFSAAQRSLVMHMRDRMEAMYRAQAGSKKHRDELAHCLRMILVGRPQDPSVTRFHLRSRGWSDSDPIRIVRIGLPAEMVETGRDQAYLSRAQITLPKAISLIHDETLVLACRERDLSLDELVRQLEKLSREMGVTIAMSDAFPGIAQAATAYRQCIVAHEVARVRGLHGIISFAEAAIPALVESIVANDMARELVDPRVTAIADSPQGQELIENLRVYLLCGCNAAKAAKRLFMHRNTLDYRIARIERIMDVELARLSEDEALRMIVSCSLESHRDQ